MIDNIENGKTNNCDYFWNVLNQLNEKINEKGPGWATAKMKLQIAWTVFTSFGCYPLLPPQKLTKTVCFWNSKFVKLPENHYRKSIKLLQDH